MLQIEDIVGVYQALMSEEKTILVVCSEKHDLIPTIWSLMSLMYPFEWQMPSIPFIYAEYQYQYVNHINCTVMGILEDSYDDVKTCILEDCGVNDDGTPNLFDRIVVVDLRHNARDQSLVSKSTFNTSFLDTFDSGQLRDTAPSMFSSMAQPENQMPQIEEFDRNYFADSGRVKNQTKSVLRTQETSKPSVVRHEMRNFTPAQQQALRDLMGVPPVQQSYLKSSKKGEQIQSQVNSKLKRLYYSEDEEVLKETVWGEHLDQDFKFQIPMRMKKQLVDSIKRIIKSSTQYNQETNLFNTSQKLNDQQILEIREKFYDTNAELFRNYHSHLALNPENGNVEFNIEEYIEEEEKLPKEKDLT